MDKQSANQVTLYKAREDTPQVLANDAAFETREPNSFSDFGAEYSSVARRPFSPSRSRKKGNIVDRDESAGWNEDVTQDNMQSILDAFLFAELRAKPKTVATAVVAATDVVTVASSANFEVGTLVLIKGLAVAANNGLKLVSAVPDGVSITVAGGIAVDEAGANATVEVVGHEFDADDLSLETFAGGFAIVSATMDMTTLGLIDGEWLFVGDDAAVNQFGGLATLTGFARIANGGIQDDRLLFDKATFTPAANDGAGDTVRLFFGTVVKNESDPDLIVKLTDTIERPLGRDADGRMSEVIKGATPNELTWNSPLANLVNVDVAYVGMRHEKRPGTTGVLAGSGATTLSAALGQDAFNTTSNLFRARLGIIDPTNIAPTPLFAKVTEWSMSINNNVSADKAQGVLGAFDTTEGMFEVGGEFTVYFRDMAAIEAIEDNADVTFDAIYSKRNAAIIMDVPLISLGGGRPEIEQDAAIMLPLETAGAESPFGHTILFNWLSYVPDAGNASG